MNKTQLKSALTKIRKLLRSKDRGQALQALEILESLGEPQLYEQLIAGLQKANCRDRHPADDSDYTCGISHPQLRGITYEIGLRLAAAAPDEAVPEHRRLLNPSINAGYLHKLPPAPRAERLHLRGAFGEQGAAALSGWTGLRDLWMELDALPDLSALGDLPDLGSVWIRYRGDDPLLLPRSTPERPGLQRLGLSRSERLEGSIFGAREIHVICDYNGVTLGALEDAGRLERIRIEGTIRGLDLSAAAPALAAAPLREVRYGVEDSGYQPLAPLTPLAGATGLEVLHLHSAASAPEELAHVSAMAGLRELTLGRASEMRDLRFLPPDAPLERLAARRAGLRSLEGLGARPTLRVLDLRDCEHLTDLSALADCPGLSLVMLHGSGVDPDTIPAGVRWAVTWGPDPEIEVMAARPAWSAR